MNDPSGRRVRLGRRSRHRKRRALRRIAFLSLVFSAAALFAWRFLPEYLVSLSRPSRASANGWQNGNAREKLALAAGQPRGKRRWVPKSRLYYPYSVVPGGVQDPADLRLAAAEDRVVARHFAQFNWDRAQLISLNKGHMAYLSYRIGDQVFWTKKRVWIPRGEKLISDGKIMARTRCGNRVEEMAQPAISTEEPDPAKFEQPLLADGSSVRGPIPVNFESSLRGEEGPSLIAEGPPPLAPLPGGILFPIGPPISACELKHLDEQDEKKCRPKPPPPAIPEPSTIALLTTGLAGVLWRYRGKLQKA